MYQPYLLFAILILSLILFVWNYWRYDFVALFALAISVLTGLVPFNKAFSGFSNPAVITVGCVMILTYAITQSGVLNNSFIKLKKLSKKTSFQVGLYSGISAFLSAFMNNVGALGIMMPIAIHAFTEIKKSPSIILMPIAFCSVLGGVITAIGTPPNLLISNFRNQVLGTPYNMFDFTPVGLPVALMGVLFVSLIGWKLVPVRAKYSKSGDSFQISDYMTEVKVPETSSMCEKTVKEFLEMTKANFELIAVVHEGKKKFAYTDDTIIHCNDILIIEASPEDLKNILDSNGLILAGNKPLTSKELYDSDIITMEAVVLPDSSIEGQSASMMRFRSRHKINLLAISREELSFRKKLIDIRFAAGDVVLLQGNAATLRETIVDLGFLPLAERDINVHLTQKKFLPIICFTLSIILASLQILPLDFSFMIAVLALILLKAIPTHSLYRTIDWSVLLLLAALIPVGEALQTTGAADLIANGFMKIAGQYSPIFALVAILVITMTLSDLLNNAATALIMAPIAIKIAQSAHVNVDSFLMAVAIGASCSFLTPIAHQNNTMVMGPGRYQFSDYFRLGLPLELIVVVVTIPTILWVWPL
ncbi:TPA: SLC13 family permease [Legionella pneumophila]|uniref:SLC13 family permease n=1 Tax=Legionella sp. PATHC039 TaxID=2992042 RepID=UPI00077852F7|nr:MULTISPECIES: SLC13 family permease [Legionella]HAT8857911.1 SLC13 family permease [Legionella pneumophila subsp. pneumophila]MCW8395247.1 SLC13 family permease [Legionella sp. PATHC039]HAT8641158.1 SLC13 family permease [Legionella pneumophila]HAT8868860.1 SLC13 family permease [Legionella pneumophila subsp. pneumophila]HAT8888807.1 SLC13 family permease [Legionella pneumophila subsp. pneumophila]